MSGQRDFSAAAATWDDNPFRVKLAWAVAGAILREVPARSDMCALDYGCGTGLVTLALQPHLREIIAADSAEGMLEQLQQKLQAAGIANVRPVRLDLEREELPEGELDLVASNMTFHHLHDPALVLRKLANGLAAGGFAAVADLDGGSEDFHDDNTGVEHYGFGVGERDAMFAQAGLVEVRTVEVTRIPKPRNGQMREYAVLLTVGRRP
ncbi:MAG: class I SAM-dependent methyltransferase [Armatimonadia bacterium]